MNPFNRLENLSINEIRNIVTDYEFEHFGKTITNVYNTTALLSSFQDIKETKYER